MIAVLTSVSFNAMAQDKNSPAPIFIQKYKQPTTISRVPTIVRPQEEQTQNTRSLRSSNKPREYKIVESPDPWAGTNFGKVTSEIDYYDQETGQRYNQYNYMALLAKRGDTQKLQQVGNYLQLNGVFDQNKYQSAVNSAAQGNAIPSTLDEAMAKNQVASAQTALERSNGATQQRAISRPSIVTKQQQNAAPKRLHQGYDEDMNADPVTSNKPIFLR